MSADSFATDRGRNRGPNIVKTAVDVEIILADGSSLGGALFLGRDQRVSDLLNDAPRFLPFQQANGEFLLVSKDQIALLKPLDRPD